MTKILRANESDCQLFKFWFCDRVCDGIRYQDQLFLQLASYSLGCRHQADEFSAKLMERGLSIIFCCSQERYLLGINPCTDWAELDTSGKRQAFGEGQGRATALFAAWVLQT
ncbi:hypothetical protein NC981_09230 [Leptolyngbya sp. DQ-M1]|uniref:hypothetical protein n=1 Tax=Leptolyngbya sp. DQ-M1 TaxID=2933920 RepID=UPI003296D8CA